VDFVGGGWFRVFVVGGVVYVGGAVGCIVDSWCWIFGELGLSLEFCGAEKGNSSF
jgi:hypothetical protein